MGDTYWVICLIVVSTTFSGLLTWGLLGGLKEMLAARRSQQQGESLENLMRKVAIRKAQLERIYTERTPTMVERKKS